MARNYFCVVFIILLIIVNNRASVVDLYTKRAASVEESAKLVKSYINESVDPCADYTSYICNGPKVLNEETPEVLIRGRMVDGNRVQKFFLEHETDIKEEKKLRDFLKLCSTSNRKKIGDVLKENTFFKIVKIWPFFEQNWMVKKLDIVQLMAEFKMYGFDIGLDVWMKKTARKKVLLIRPAAINKDYIINRRNGGYVLRSLGIRSPETINTDAESFFKEFSKVIPYDEENNTPELEMTYGELKKNFSDFDWDRYFRIFSDMVPDNSLEILVVNPERIKAAIFTIENIEPRKVVNFIFLQLATRLYDHLIENGPYTCYTYAFMIFQPTISRILVDKYYNDEFREKFLGTMDILLETIEADFHLLKIPHDAAMKKLEKIINEEFLPSLTSTHSNRRLKGWNVDEDNLYGSVMSFYPIMFKEVIQNFLKTKGLEKRILNTNFISYLITKSLFDFEKQPAILQYDSIAAPVIIEVIDWSKKEGAKEFEENTSEGVKEEFIAMTNSTIGSAYLFQSTQYYLKLYQKWAQKHQDVIKKEDEILKPYGLNSMKILFSVLRSVCPRHKTINKNKEGRLEDSDTFVKEYNCDVETAFLNTE